ncbi:MAG: hypothetical protein AAFO91_04360 [Bacteroidota bacterium]
MEILIREEIERLFGSHSDRVVESREHSDRVEGKGEGFEIPREAPETRLKRSEGLAGFGESHVVLDVEESGLAGLAALARALPEENVAVHGLRELEGGVHSHRLGVKGAWELAKSRK